MGQPTCGWRAVWADWLQWPGKVLRQRVAGAGCCNLASTPICHMLRGYVWEHALFNNRKKSVNVNALRARESCWNIISEAETKSVASEGRRGPVAGIGL